jgi:hypothetical protein
MKRAAPRAWRHQEKETSDAERRGGREADQ